MQTTFSCIIVDDNEIARLSAVSFINKYPFLKIAAVVESAEAALVVAQNNPPDVLLLDIDMPGMSGLELREKLLHIPACIFITSYPDYAIEGFEKDALDFLVKPLNADRFAKAMERLKEYLTIRNKAMQLDCFFETDTLFIKDGYNKIKIQLQEVIFLEALKDYTGIVTANKKYCVLSLLGNILKEKSFESFIRIHRSYAVQKKYITKITASEVVVNNISLPLGRSYKDALTDL
jgi:two-component system LytT family response regulator